MSAGRSLLGGLAVSASLSLAALLCSSGCDPRIDGSSPGSAARSTEPGADCPAAESVPDDWETFVDASRRVTFRYPPDLGTAYIHAVDWPPQPAVEAGPFTCTEAGAETARAGRTEPWTVDGRTFCVTRVMEGAAGSVYTMYAYAIPAGDEVVYLRFSLRAVQCGNYDDPTRSRCERERAAFSTDPILADIVGTIRVDGSCARRQAAPQPVARRSSAPMPWLRR
jgi:hypothetical protein